jgi:polyhydroxyalkanoate synthesis regulator phasin
MTYQADRTYWRMSSTAYLIEQARHSGSELAIVLGERLEEYIDQEHVIDELQRENKELEERVESWREEVDALRAQLGLD